MVQIIDHPPLIAQRRLKEVTSRFIQDISEKNRCHFQFNNQISFCAAGSFPALLISFAEHVDLKISIYYKQSKKENHTNSDTSEKRSIF